MPNDAKLGLVVGLGLVIAVAVIYFRHDSSRHQEESPAATAVKPASATRQPPPRGQSRATKARPAVQVETTEQAQAEPRRHAVAAGDTLANLAERYYGDREKSDEIYRVNRGVLKGPDDLPIGIVLVIPDLPAKDRGDAAQREP